MASNSKGTGIGIMFLLGVVAIGYSNAGWGSAASGEVERDAGAVGSGDLAGQPATCDGVLSLETEPGPVLVPGHTAEADAATTTCVMGIDRGGSDAVAALQDALSRCHGEAVAVDGVYGSATADAVASVQRQAGIEADGAYGPATLAAMRWPAASSDPAPCVAVAAGARALPAGSTLPLTG